MDKPKEKYQHQIDRHEGRVASYKATASDPRATEYSMEPGEIDLAEHLSKVKSFRQSKAQTQSQSQGNGLRISQSQSDQG